MPCARVAQKASACTGLIGRGLLSGAHAKQQLTRSIVLPSIEVDRVWQKGGCEFAC